MQRTDGLDHLNGAELAWEQFGDPADPAIVLVSGTGTSREWWDAEFCERIAAGDGHGTSRVIRYDLRDTGESTTGEAGAPAYTVMDLVGDLAALIERVDGAPAYLVGMSFGGGLVQQLALERPDLVAGVALLSTSPAGPGSTISAELPPPTDALIATFEREDAGPDWSDAASVAAYWSAGERPYAGSIPVDDARILRIAHEVVARAGDQSAAMNHMLAEPGAAARSDIGAITVPALVIHGSDDPLFPLEHGRRLAETIPDAQLVVVPGHGHQNPPPPTWDLIVPAILDHARSVDRTR